MLILRVNEIKDVCNVILNATDPNKLSTFTESIQIECSNNILTFKVSNGDYVAKITLPYEGDENFKAVVNAELFLSLVSKTTSETLSLETEENKLIFKGNGEYKLPFIFEDDELMNIPDIEISNVLSQVEINSSILKDILKYNTRELQNNMAFHPAQRFYYMDDEGAITFTSGACITNFNINTGYKFLLNQKLVKLFKLFKSDKVQLTYGEDDNNNSVEKKLRFSTPQFEITAYLPNDPELLEAVPTEAIRGRANKEYPYNININPSVLLGAIERLMLFTSNNLNYGIFEFNKTSVVIYTQDKKNEEEVAYENISSLSDTYEAMIDFSDLKNGLSNLINSNEVSIKFGDSQAFVLNKSNINIIIPETIL